MVRRTRASSPAKWRSQTPRTWWAGGEVNEAIARIVGRARENAGLLRRRPLGRAQDLVDEARHDSGKALIAPGEHEELVALVLVEKSEQPGGALLHRLLIDVARGIRVQASSTAVISARRASKA